MVTHWEVEMTKPRKMMPSRLMTMHTSISAGVLALMSPAHAVTRAQPPACTHNLIVACLHQMSPACSSTEHES